MTSGESDFLFDEDVDSDMDKQNEYGEEELEDENEEPVGEEGNRPVSKGSNFRDVHVLKQAEFANEQSASSEPIDDDEEKDELANVGDNEEFLNADGKINWQWIFLQERVMGEPQ